MFISSHLEDFKMDQETQQTLQRSQTNFSYDQSIIVKCYESLHQDMKDVYSR